MKLAAERQELILAEVRRRATVRASDLVAMLAVSQVTVRRDVAELADRGLVSRVHGGLMLPRHGQPETKREALRSSFGPVATGALVGMVVPSVEYYRPVVIQGAQATMAMAGGRLSLRTSSYHAAEDRRQIGRLLERGVHALLAAPSTSGRAGLNLSRWLGSLPIPVVLVERRPPPELPTLGLDAATTAHTLGAGLAVRHLVTLGHRQVGLVISRSSPTSRALRAGWREVIASLDVAQNGAFDVEAPTYGAPGWAEIYDGVLRQCRRRGVGALLVHADREAIGMIERARDRDIDVPGELAVVSYDDEVAGASDPPSTAVRPAKHRLGALAAELALARLAGGEDHPVHRVELWPTLVVRESCGASRRGRPKPVR